MNHQLIFGIQSAQAITSRCQLKLNNGLRQKDFKFLTNLRRRHLKIITVQTRTFQQPVSGI
jgi:hypothetical protein